MRQLYTLLFFICSTMPIVTQSSVTYILNMELTEEIRLQHDMPNKEVEISWLQKYKIIANGLSIRFIKTDRIT